MSAALVVTAPASATESLYRLSVAQYHAALAAGVFGEGDAVELLEGLLVEKMPKNPPHVLALGNLAELLARCVTAGWHLRTQDPVTLADGEPEPDLVVARGTRRAWSSRHPGASDLALVVEVSDATLDRDRGIKLRSYARASVEAYWIVNLIDRCVEVYTRPDPAGSTPGYRDRATFAVGESVPFTLDGVERGRVPVADVMP